MDAASSVPQINTEATLLFSAPTTQGGLLGIGPAQVAEPQKLP